MQTILNFEISFLRFTQLLILFTGLDVGQFKEEEDCKTKTFQENQKDQTVKLLIFYTVIKQGCNPEYHYLKLDNNCKKKTILTSNEEDQIARALS